VLVLALSLGVFACALRALHRQPAPDRGGEEDLVGALFGWFEEEEEATPTSKTGPTTDEPPLTSGGVPFYSEDDLRRLDAVRPLDGDFPPPLALGHVMPEGLCDLPRAHARLRPGLRCQDVWNELGPAEGCRDFVPQSDDPGCLARLLKYTRGGWRLAAAGVARLPRRGARHRPGAAAPAGRLRGGAGAAD
jgi:hypothetical protein